MHMDGCSNLLDVQGLSVGYSTRLGMVKALHDVDFDVKSQEVAALVGESGSGKTTLAWAIMGHLGPSGRAISGRILFAGENLLEKGEAEMRLLRGRRISMVYQEPMSSLNPSMRVGTQIGEILSHHGGASSREAWRRAISLLGELQIPDPDRVARRYPHQLSGGMQQRVVIGMAIVCSPQLLIMDEPTTSLDVTIQAKMLSLIEDLKKRGRWAILYITHDLAVVAEIADQVSVIYAGVVMETAPVAELFAAPTHPYTRGLLRCVARADRPASKRGFVSIPGSIPDLRAMDYEGCLFAARCQQTSSVCLEAEIPLISKGASHFVRCPGANPEVTTLPEHCEEASDNAPAQETIEQEGILRCEELHVYFTTRGGTRAPRLVGRDRVVRAVDGVDLALCSGETLALVGETGCGKTTLARGLGRLVIPTSGRVLYNGEELTRRQLTQFRHDVQFVFQDPDSALNPTRRIGAILGRALRRAGRIAGRTRVEAVAELLALVNLPRQLADRYPHELSGGQKQRVCIARAFAYQPRIVICDEPTAALDVSVQASILNLFVKLQKDHETAYLFISHDLSVVRSLADRVMVMYLGKVCETGPTEAVFAEPHHPYVEALISAVPVPDPSSRKERILLAGTIPSITKVPSGCRFHTRCPRKIGTVCESVPPELEAITASHSIACHLYGSGEQSPPATLEETAHTHHGAQRREDHYVQ